MAGGAQRGGYQPLRRFDFDFFNTRGVVDGSLHVFSGKKKRPDRSSRVPWIAL